MPLKNINGTMLHFETHGRGVPIVFIHPPLLTSANFRYQVAQLSEQFQVVTFDIRGHGRSDQTGVPITYELISEDIKQLMDHLKIDKAFICGYSTGGSVALEAMLTYPDRFWGGILISAMSEASDFMLRNRIRIAIGLSGWRLALRLLMLGITLGNSDSTTTFRNLLNDSRGGNCRNIQQYYRCSLKYNCTKRLSQIKSPVLLLYGEKNRSFRRYYKIFQQGLQQFNLVIVSKVRHQLPTKAAAEIAKTMTNWIQNVIGENQNSDLINNSMLTTIGQEASGERELHPYSRP